MYWGARETVRIYTGENIITRIFSLWLKLFPQTSMVKKAVDVQPEIDLNFLMFQIKIIQDGSVFHYDS